MLAPPRPLYRSRGDECGDAPTARRRTWVSISSQKLRGLVAARWTAPLPVTLSLAGVDERHLGGLGNELSDEAARRIVLGDTRPQNLEIRALDMDR